MPDCSRAFICVCECVICCVVVVQNMGNENLIHQSVWCWLAWILTERRTTAEENSFCAGMKSKSMSMMMMMTMWKHDATFFSCSTLAPTLSKTFGAIDSIHTYNVIYTFARAVIHKWNKSITFDSSAWVWESLPGSQPANQPASACLSSVEHCRYGSETLLWALGKNELSWG